MFLEVSTSTPACTSSPFTGGHIQPRLTRYSSILSATECSATTNKLISQLEVWIPFSPSPPRISPDRSITESWRSLAKLHSDCTLHYLHLSPSPTQQTRSWWMNVRIHGWTQCQVLPQTHPSLHHWTAWGVPQVKSPPHRMSPTTMRKCQRSELRRLRSKLCPSSVLHAGSQSNSTAWNFAGGVPQVPGVESHPEGPSKRILVPTSHVQYLSQSTRFPTSPHRWGLGRAEPSCVTERLRRNWQPTEGLQCSVRSQLLLLSHVSIQNTVCSISPHLACYSPCASPERKGVSQHHSPYLTQAK